MTARDLAIERELERIRNDPDLTSSRGITKPKEAILKGFGKDPANHVLLDRMLVWNFSQQTRGMDDLGRHFYNPERLEKIFRLFFPLLTDTQRAANPGAVGYTFAELDEVLSSNWWMGTRERDRLYQSWLTRTIRGAPRRLFVRWSPSEYAFVYAINLGDVSRPNIQQFSIRPEYDGSIRGFGRVFPTLTAHRNAAIDLMRRGIPISSSLEASGREEEEEKDWSRWLM